MDKLKVKYPRFLYVDFNGLSVLNQHGLKVAGFGYAEPICGEDGVPIQKPGFMQVKVMFPFHIPEVWIPRECLMSEDSMCTRMTFLGDEIRHLQRQMENLQALANRANLELRQYQLEEAKDEAEL